MTNTYRALDIAKYIINHEHEEGREISNLRLQKLLYFIQAKFIVETGKPCFSDPIEAWDFGPVVTSVYHEYKLFGSFDIASTDTAVSIDEESASRIKNMLDFCSHYPTYQLVEITHNQTPWKRARENPFSHVITLDSMEQYFRRQ